MTETIDTPRSLAGTSTTDRVPELYKYLLRFDLLPPEAARRAEIANRFPKKQPKARGLKDALSDWGPRYAAAVEAGDEPPSFDQVALALASEQAYELARNTITAVHSTAVRRVQAAMIDAEPDWGPVLGQRWVEAVTGIIDLAPRITVKDPLRLAADPDQADAWQQIDRHLDTARALELCRWTLGEIARERGDLGAALFVRDRHPRKTSPTIRHIEPPIGTMHKRIATRHRLHPQARLRA